MDDEMKAAFAVDAVVTVVDAKHVGLHWDDSREVKEQIAFADVLLLNKTDLVTPADLDRLEARIRAINALANIYRCAHADVPLDRVLGVHGFDLNRILEMEPDFLVESSHAHDEDDHDHAHCDHEHGHCEHDHDDDHHDHVHDESIVSVGIQAEGECNGRKLNEWLGNLLQQQGQNIFRMKGVFAVQGQPKRIVFQGVHMLMQAQADRDWKPGEKRKNILVFIGRELDRKALNEGFKACLV
jgi:G3E family GTPase